MKKFSFRLEPLLKLRQHEENQKQRSYSAAYEKVRRQELENEQVSKTHQNLVDRQRGALQGPLSTTILQSYARYFRKLKTDQLTGHQVLGVLRRDAETKRRELIAASRERKKFEKLKEIQQDRFHRDAAALEQKETDETAAVTYRRLQKS